MLNVLPQTRDQRILHAASLEASREAYASSISGKLSRFRSSGNPAHLVAAILQTHREGRLSELLYTMWCTARYRPSPVTQDADPEILRIAASYRGWNRRGQYLTRPHLVALYKNRFDMETLPDDFVGTRVTNIVDFGDRLLIGEYAIKRSARMVVLSDRGCDITDHYTHNPAIRHIHAIHRVRDTNDLVITTGDSAKYLDFWTMGPSVPRFVRRVRERHAGHTAIVELAGRLWMGTDFSGRRNWLETLDGDRWFLPRPAHNMFILQMYPHADRYIAILSTEIAPEGRHTLSIFDTRHQTFIYSDYVEVTRQDVPLRA